MTKKEQDERLKELLSNIINNANEHELIEVDTQLSSINDKIVSRIIMQEDYKK